ncbi:MAG: putative Phage integrase [Bradyrhizobium sp.]|nr:putative Phage integrase [Bradyrhizobium sp.]
MGFPDACIPLPAEADDAEIERLCHEYGARLRAWIDEAKKAGPEHSKIRYDGTVASACDVYTDHPFSPYNTNIAESTRGAYQDSLKLLKRTVGSRLIRNLTVFDCQHWYAEWRKPAILSYEKNGTPVLGPERIDRAHDAISMFKTVIRFVAAGMRRAECRQLADELTKIRFEKGGAREQELTYAQVTAFLAAAQDLSARRVMLPERARYLSIGVAAQFELLLRQKDIIGGWGKPGRKLPKGVAIETHGEEDWAGFFTWENIPGWRWRMKTSKSKYRAAADFDLTIYGLLYPLLEAVPFDERHGAIIKGEHGLPIRYRSYIRWFRQIARAANIPDEVWSMDSRAGGATEAEEGGAAFEDIQGALTHSKKQEATTGRYFRRQARTHRAVAEVRQAKRVADEKGGT